MRELLTGKAKNGMVTDRHTPVQILKCCRCPWWLRTAHRIMPSSPCPARFYNRRGTILTLCPGDYWIDLLAQEEECFIPLQTMNDIFSSCFWLCFVFNSKKGFGDVAGGMLSAQAGEAA